MTSLTPPYPYPTPNPTLIKTYNLEKHFEGGYFNQTVALESHPAASSTEDRLHPTTAEGRQQSAWGPATTLLGENQVKDESPEKQGGRLDATQIYYLLTTDSYRGKMHMNLHSHFHLLHQGRALYTLINPTTPPTIYRIVLGHDTSLGEVPQLYVPGGWWKASEIPEEDRLLLDAPDAKEGLGKELKDSIGCLISEIVIPGWTPEQHVFLDEDKLKSMWAGKDGWQVYEKYLKSAP
ncbi:RmlC-like cupin domain-containing protein [Naematelia encephala]|uniref:RmlC-like cupin domain-containing protein n=1 Tax=Naematelia encephala TaxID=71784 RepID=A0A1Y2BAZ7_9TREE|nr:RmlC-like cupin domain-containing protein [Naematelia encephala]